MVSEKEKTAFYIQRCRTNIKVKLPLVYKIQRYYIMTITGLKITDSLVHTEKPLQKQKPLMKKMGRVWHPEWISFDSETLRNKIFELKWRKLFFILFICCDKVTFSWCVTPTTIYLSIKVCHKRMNDEKKYIFFTWKASFWQVILIFPPFIILSFIISKHLAKTIRLNLRNFSGIWK